MVWFITNSLILGAYDRFNVMCEVAGGKLSTIARKSIGTLVTFEVTIINLVVGTAGFTEELR